MLDHHLRNLLLTGNRRRDPNQRTKNEHIEEFMAGGTLTLRGIVLNLLLLLASVTALMLLLVLGDLFIQGGFKLIEYINEWIE